MPQYIDPGNGSLLLQLLLSAVVGVSFAFRHRLRMLLHRFRRRHGEDAGSDIEGPKPGA